MPVVGHQAHPRSRGENAAEETAVDIHLGSSPLARGKPQCSGGGGLCRGLIPARAGKTIVLSFFEVRGAAHPRSRGENEATAMATWSVQGSSPLARGKPSANSLPYLSRRLIPARAGKTPALAAKSPKCAAHPRSRGENGLIPRVLSVGGGSSPLARGKPRRTRNDSVRPRLIPARAGKTCWLVVKLSECWAHPRSRGENFSGASESNSRCGSSPLARGKRREDRLTLTRLGLIPARAGKTVDIYVGDREGGAHPRSRGENALRPGWGLQPLGSSPLARGKPGPACGTPRRRRLIPARAGKTTAPN